MNLSDIKQVLADRDIRLTKSLGQNFLHDGNQLARIVAAAELTASDRVLEVGPGLGPLTERLLSVAGSVLAVEMDRRLVDWLRERFHGEPKLHLLHADALRYLKEKETDWSDWKLVANLPYSVASPILVELALGPRPPRLMVVTLQHEVARRLIAQPGETDYGVLSLLVGLRYEPDGLFKIPPACFFPVPDVDSACLTLTRRADPSLSFEHQRVFVRIVKRGFSQRRKMMIKLLKTEWPLADLQSAFAELGLSEQVRAERVAREQFVRLTELLLKMDS